MSVLVAQADARHLPLADESVHLIVTSPPYNAGIRYDAHVDRLPWDDYWQGLIEPMLRECHRVLVHGGRIALNIGNVMPGPDGWARFMLPTMMSHMEAVGFLPREHITWVKADVSNPEDAATGLSTAWGSWRSASNPVVRALSEPVVVMSKGAHARGERGESDITAAEFMAWTRNVWLIRAGSHVRFGGHPAAFPSELARRLIKLYSYVGDVVADPFAGSGTTVRAALDAGRVGVGFDISAGYSRVSKRRVEQPEQLSLLEVVA